VTTSSPKNWPKPSTTTATTPAWDSGDIVPWSHFARVALEWLAERGRLTPDGAKVEEWWNVEFHPAGSPPGHRTTAWDTASQNRASAEEYVRDWGRVGLDTRLVRREIHRYPDGSYLTWQWEPVAEEQT
jgi:hypothetical protein